MNILRWFKTNYPVPYPKTLRMQQIVIVLGILVAANAPVYFEWRINYAATNPHGLLQHPAWYMLLWGASCGFISGIGVLLLLSAFRRALDSRIE